MNTLAPKRIEIHQLEGQDRRKRVFNRHVEIHRMENRYVSSFQYEGKSYWSDSQPIIKAALDHLVQKLHQAGFSQLRSRLNFRGKRYLAEREPWTNYETPDTPS